MLCIQETHRGPIQDRPRIPGMTLVIESPHEKYGSAIFVKAGTSAESTLNSNNIENPTHYFEWTHHHFHLQTAQ